VPVPLPLVDEPVVDLLQLQAGLFDELSLIVFLYQPRPNTIQSLIRIQSLQTTHLSSYLFLYCFLSFFSKNSFNNRIIIKECQRASSGSWI
jgi:hypothetical protein